MQSYTALADAKDHTLMFQKPAYAKYSAWITHVPFAFFLVDIVRPRTIVELGVHQGVSFFAFCQAVRALRMETQCFGVDHWEGDAHAGRCDEALFRSVLRYKNQQYSECATFLKMSFDDAFEHFQPGSIDLLHIDGYHTYEAVHHDFTSWLPKLSERGVVLLHDTQVKRRGFGVWKLWEEIKQTYPTFEFSHGYGLGVVAVGKEAQQEYAPLFASWKADPEFSPFFRQLGRSHAPSPLEHLKNLVRL